MTEPSVDRTVSVRLVGVFKKAYGKDRVTVEMRGKEALRDAIKRLVQSSPDLGRLLIDPELGTPLPNAVILVNGKEINLLNGLNTTLMGGDEVVLIPVIHGG